MNAVIGDEKERVACYGQMRRGPDGPPRQDVFDHGGSCFGSIAPPQLGSVHAVIRNEEQRSIKIGQFGKGDASVFTVIPGTQAASVGVDILDQDSPAGRSVSLP